MFLALLRQLHENPECRQHLADPAFREMFTIPPLHPAMAPARPHVLKSLHCSELTNPQPTLR